MAGTLARPARLARALNSLLASRLRLSQTKQKGRVFTRPSSTFYKLELNRHSMRRRRFTPVSHTRSDYCAFASSTRLYPTRSPVLGQSPVLGTKRIGII